MQNSITIEYFASLVSHSYGYIVLSNASVCNFIPVLYYLLRFVSWHSENLIPTVRWQEDTTKFSLIWTGIEHMAINTMVAIALQPFLSATVLTTPASFGWIVHTDIIVIGYAMPCIIQ